MLGEDPPIPGPEEGVTAEQYRQRALLMADLGRYDEATGELAAGLTLAPDDPQLLTALARVHLAADQSADALAAAERALAAAPATIGPLVARAMALIDLRDFGLAAEISTQLLRQWPDDPYVQRTGAALLSESRNGQEALNAAWTAVSRSPESADAHLVLSVVAARLRQFGLAQRAYGEALELDPTIGEAQHDCGVVRLERRRWARAIQDLADTAVIEVPPDAAGPGRGLEPPPVVRPAGSVLDSAERDTAAFDTAVRYAGAAILAAALAAAVMAPVSAGASRVWAAVMATLLGGVIVIWLRRQLTQPLAAVLRQLQHGRRRLLAAGCAAAAAPALLLAYALVGGLVPLVAALVAATLAELLVLAARR